MCGTKAEIHDLSELILYDIYIYYILAGVGYTGSKLLADHPTQGSQDPRRPPGLSLCQCQQNPLRGNRPDEWTSTQTQVLVN